MERRSRIIGPKAVLTILVLLFSQHGKQLVEFKIVSWDPSSAWHADIYRHVDTGKYDVLGERNLDYLDTFVDRKNRKYEIYYLESFDPYPEVQEWFWKSCQRLINSGYALKDWDYRQLSYQSIVAFYSNKPVGSLAFLPDIKSGLLDNNALFVERSHRGTDLSEKMHRCLAQWGVKNGFFATIGIVHNKNRVAMAHGLSLGYSALPFTMLAWKFGDK